MTELSEFDLSGQVTIVTGGTRGIGLAIAEGFARAGATVIPTSRTESAVEDAVTRMEERGADTEAIVTDVADGASVEELVDRTTAAFGGLDVLVNNAGINPRPALGPPEAIDSESVGEVLEVNLKGSYRCLRAAAPHLQESENAAVVNVASLGGLVGIPRQHPYVASKHGLVGITKSMALDWAPGIRVNAIAPGYVATDLTAEIRENEQLHQSVLNRTPLERFAEPEEIAGPAVFLASNAASFVTGETLTVDGGWVAQ